MSYSLIHILSSGKGSDGIVQILIFFVFIAVMVIKNIFMAQKQQQSQQKKRPVSQRPPQKSSTAAKKPIVTSDRVEEFLESLLSPKNLTQQNKKPFLGDKSLSSGKPIVSQGFQQKSSQSGNAARPVSHFSGNSDINVPSKSKYDVPFAKINKQNIPVITPGSSIMDMPSIDDKIREMPEYTDQAIKKMSKSPSIKQPAKISDSLLPAFSDSDDLKRAIIYSEILGKPVSIRESS